MSPIKACLATLGKYLRRRSNLALAPKASTTTPPNQKLLLEALEPRLLLSADLMISPLAYAVSDSLQAEHAALFESAQLIVSMAPIAAIAHDSVPENAAVA